MTTPTRNQADITPAKAAKSAAEAVRALGQTINRAGDLTPSEIDSVVGDLAVLTERLSPVLAYATRWVHQARTDRLLRLGEDQACPGFVTISALNLADRGIDEASYRITQLSSSLAVVRSVTSRLTECGANQSSSGVVLVDLPRAARWPTDTGEEA
jgi:hypothetical protein